MNRKLMLCLISLAALLVMTAALLPSAPAQADNLLQGVPLLTGYKIYFTEANGEASRFDRSDTGISRLAGLLRLLGAELETLEWRTGIPADADLIIVAGLTGDFSADQTARLWAYLDRDASLLLMLDPLLGSGRNITGMSSASSLFNLMWTDVGMRGRDDVVVTEDTSGPVLGLISAFEAVSFNAEHPVTAGLDEPLYFSVARSIEIDAALDTFTVSPLVFSPPQYYGESKFTEYLETDLAQFNIGQDFPRGAQTLAVAAENRAANTRIAIIGDRNFALNGGGLRTSPPTSAAFLHPGNARFLTRLVGWLLQADPANTYQFNFATPGPTATATITPTPVITNADLALAAKVSTSSPNVGDAVVYEVSISNTGPDVATRITALIPLPEGVTFVSATATTRRGYNNQTGVWDVGDLNAGASGTLTIVVTINPETSGKTIGLLAGISASDAIDPNPANDSALVEMTITEDEE